MATYGRCPTTTWRRLPSRVVLAVPGRPDALELNAAGAVLWDLLEEPADRSTLTSRLVAAFERPEAEVTAAVGDMLEELVACGAIEQR